MNEQVRKIIRKHVLQAIKDCAREYYDEPTPEEEADATVDQIAALWPKPLDVGEIDITMKYLCVSPNRCHPKKEVMCHPKLIGNSCMGFCSLPFQECRYKADLTPAYQSVASRFCAPVGSPVNSPTALTGQNKNRGDGMSCIHKRVCKYSWAIGTALCSKEGCMSFKENTQTLAGVLRQVQKEIEKNIPNEGIRRCWDTCNAYGEGLELAIDIIDAKIKELEQNG